MPGSATSSRRDVAQQDGDEGAHLDHAVAARQLALVQHLGQM